MIDISTDLSRKSSIFRYLQKCKVTFRNFRNCSRTGSCSFCTTFVKSSEIFEKWPEIFGKSSKKSLLLVIISIKWFLVLAMAVVPADASEPFFGAKLEAWRHKMFQIFHFLQADLVF